MTNDGMLVQWLQLYEMSPDLIASIIMSVNKYFSDYKVFVNGSDLIILASNSSIKSSASDLALKTPKIASLLREISIEHEYDFQSNYIGGKKSLFYLTEMFNIPLNSDYNPILDLSAVKARFAFTEADEYSTMSNFIIPVRKIIENDTIDVVHQMFGREMHFEQPNASNVCANYDAWQTWFYITSLGTTQEAFADSVVSKRVAFKAAHIRMISHDNSEAAHQAWPKYVLELLEITMPYLPPTRMKDIWAFIDKEGVDIVLKQYRMDVLTTLRCITYGDFETAYTISLKQLTQTRIPNEEYIRIFSAAFLISSIKLNKFENIEKVWNRIGGIRMDFNLMMLYDYAYHQSSTRSEIH
jgi:hypothetical protein